MTKAITIQNLHYSYQTAWLRKKISVLKGINLEINQGEAFGFLGQNGAGKTTTIKCILDICHPTSGNIKILNTDSLNPESRRPIGFLPEQPYWYDHLTVEQTLAFYGDLYGINKDIIPSSIRDALTKVGMESRKKSTMRTLSKGLTQRIGLATTILHNPSILILDEPFSGLDPIGRKDFRDIFLHYKDKGSTLFMSSHILDDVSQICDRVSILKDGSLATVISLKDQIQSQQSSTQYELRYFKNGQSHNLLLESEEQANQELKNQTLDGAKILYFGAVPKSLEQIFIETVKK